jgi:DNA-directed RNA polymerase subunit delta
MDMAVELKKYEGQNRDELAMIDVAHEILEVRKQIMEFNELVNEIQNYLGKSDIEIRESLAQFYTELNIDGSFISLGNNVWGLRSWYGIDEIDEEVAHDEEEEGSRKKHKKRLNAFATSEDDDVIDYNDDDPEDDFEEEEDDLSDVDGDEDDEKAEVEAYDSDLREIEIDEDGLEEELDVDFGDDDVEEEEDEDSVDSEKK